MYSLMLIYFMHLELRARFNLRLICVAQHNSERERESERDEKNVARTKKSILKWRKRNALRQSSKWQNVQQRQRTPGCIEPENFNTLFIYPFFVRSQHKLTHTQAIVYNSISVCNEFHFSCALVFTLPLHGSRERRQSHEQNNRQPHSVIHTFSNMCLLCV